jgi:hypothetical protein
MILLYIIILCINIQYVYIYRMYNMNYTPNEIANIIFKEPPKEKKFYSFMPADDDDNEHFNTSYIFEILVQILFEGFNILTNNLSNVDIDKLTESDIKSLNKWFNSIGFDIFVEEHLENIFTDYYCISIINNNLYDYFFKEKNIDAKFHFLLNNNYVTYNNTHSLSAIYTIISGKHKIFKIYFNFCS